MATPGDQQATIAFTAGADGGSPITGYEYSLDAGANWMAFCPAIVGSPGVITGLNNGTAYSVQLRAVNSTGPGAASLPVSVTPLAVPGAPTDLVATPGNGQAQIAFVAVPDGGSAVTNYEYTLDAGATWTAFAPAVMGSPVVVTGLTNGTAYSVALRALNGAGAGASSAPVVVTPSTVPAAPTGLVATPGNQQASVAFTAGADGGSAITNYEYSLDAGTTWIASNPPVTGSPVVVTGLTNGTAYSILLRAVNAAGAGAPSAAVDVTPLAVPGAPTNLVATPGYGEASVAFTAAPDNGSPLTGYEYSTDAGATWIPTGSTNPSFTISGLTNGVPLNVVVRGVSALGNGTSSSPVVVEALGAVFVPVTPVRAYDSRTTGGALSSGQSRTVAVDVPGGVPAGAVAVAYNLTVTDTVNSGWIALAPGGTVTAPDSSTINWVNGQTVANGFTVSVNQAGDITAFAGGGGSAQFIVDVVGYYGPEAVSANGGEFVPLTPVRAYDSRDGG